MLVKALFALPFAAALLIAAKAEPQPVAPPPVAEPSINAPPEVVANPANRLMLESFVAPDFVEGVNSFLERRDPRFPPLGS